ncbi:DUF3501 family protein [Ideonella sp. DXS29W]|uniref:DUF3501 family protein n=1 Tax=Ideonella lacteola TaxID=2984193 RepID=A0ABU9BMY7_9BURK
MIDAASLMTLQAYSLHRHEHRRKLAAHRRQRTLSLGPQMRLQFEDELTVRHQIQEVLWMDRRADDADAVGEEIATYAHLVPDGGQWTATLMIELPDAAERQYWMPILNEAVQEVYVELPGHARVAASVNDDLPCQHRGRDSGVHFLRFRFDTGHRERLQRDGEALLGCTHHRYHWRRTIPRGTLASLLRDLVQPRPAPRPCPP